MGVMYAMKCDLCGKVQVKEQAADIKGRTYMEGSVQKFACSKCDSMMKAAFEIKKDGLRKPLSKVARLVAQRDRAFRERDEAKAALRGESPFARVGGAMNDKLKWAPAPPPPKGGGAAMLAGYAHSEFRILRMTRLRGSRPQFVVTVQDRKSGSVYHIRVEEALLSSPESFCKALREASGGAIGNEELSKNALDHMVSSAPKEEVPRKKRGGKA